MNCVYLQREPLLLLRLCKLVKKVWRVIMSLNLAWGPDCGDSCFEFYYWPCKSFGGEKKNQLLVNLRSEVRSFICSSKVTRHRYTISRHHSKIRWRNDPSSFLRFLAPPRFYCSPVWTSRTLAPYILSHITFFYQSLDTLMHLKQQYVISWLQSAASLLPPIWSLKTLHWITLHY